MSKPCPCGASPIITGCPPCFKASERERYKRDYWRNKAPFRTRKLGRPRKADSVKTATAKEAPRPHMDKVNPIAADFLRRPLRAHA